MLVVTTYTYNVIIILQINTFSFCLTNSTSLNDNFSCKTLIDFSF